MKVNHFFRSTVFALLGLGLATWALPLQSSWANGNEAADLVAPYAHFPLVLGSAPGPFSTRYMISNSSDNLVPPSNVTVNVKCYNDRIERVGPAAGTTINLNENMMTVASPVSLGLTTDLKFTGFGLCYFARTSGSLVAVSFTAGVEGGGAGLISNDNSVAIMSDTAQSQVTESPGLLDNSDANVPFWTQQGSWHTFLLALNPTAVGTDMRMDVYNEGGLLLGSWDAPGFPGLAPRDLDFTGFAAAVPATAGSLGHADITADDRGFMGWIAGVNLSSFQAFITSIPLSMADVSDLGSVGSDRP